MRSHTFNYTHVKNIAKSNAYTYKLTAIINEMLCFTQYVKKPKIEKMGNKKADFIVFFVYGLVLNFPRIFQYYLICKAVGSCKNL